MKKLLFLLLLIGCSQTQKPYLTDLRCGVGWASLPKSDPAYWICAMHDLDYICGGSLEEKKEADENFRKNCEFNAKQKQSRWTELEAILLPPTAAYGGQFCWKPYSRMDDYLAEGRALECLK